MENVMDLFPDGWEDVSQEDLLAEGGSAAEMVGKQGPVEVWHNYTSGLVAPFVDYRDFPPFRDGVIVQDGDGFIFIPSLDDPPPYPHGLDAQAEKWGRLILAGILLTAAGLLLLFWSRIT